MYGMSCISKIFRRWVMKKIFLSALILAAFGLLVGCATTPLTNAALHGRTEEVKALLDKGANANEADEIGWTPLMAAAYRSKNMAMAKLLIDKGADIDAALARCKRYPNDGEAKICIDILEKIKGKRNRSTEINKRDEGFD
jgi:ankyrin repeat protein